MLRRVIPRRATAVVATGVLALAGAVVLSAPAAQAAEVTYTSTCTNQHTGPQGDSETKVDFEVSPDKPTYQVGDVVTVTWKWLAYANVPDDIPLDSVPADSTQPFGDITVSGAQAATVNTVGPAEHPEALKGEPLLIADMTGQLTLTAAGTVDLAPKDYRTVSLGISTTTCVPADGQVPGVSVSLTVEGDQQEATLNAPDGPVHTGAEFPVTGSGFIAGTAPDVTLCDADGSNCLADRITVSAINVTPDGDLTGTLQTPATLPDGDYLIKVLTGAAAATAPLKVEKYVPVDPRTAETDVAGGPLGSAVVITGENWNPNLQVNIAGANVNGDAVDTTRNIRTNPDGTFRAEYTVLNPNVTQLRIREGLSSVNRVFVPFEVTAGAVDRQTVTVGLTAGGLTMTQAGTGIDFGTATLNGEAQTLDAALNQVTVVDARGGDLGWTLTGTMSDLTADGGTIPANNVSWTPACAASESSLSTVTTGSAGPIGDGATLCSQDDSDDTTTTGGRFTADADMTLTTPEFAPAGSYTGTLTLTLS